MLLSQVGEGPGDLFPVCCGTSPAPVDTLLESHLLQPTDMLQGVFLAWLKIQEVNKAPGFAAVGLFPVCSERLGWVMLLQRSHCVTDVPW